MWLLVMHDGGARVRTPVSQVHVTPLAAVVVSGQDGPAQGTPLLGVVQLAVFVGGG